MTVFTNVSDDVLEPGDPIRSVDILAIKNNAVFVGQFVNEQIFNANGTWTKPLQDGVEIGQMARIQVWGGGGGGGRQAETTASAGGAGGGYNEIIIALSTLASSVAVTIGAGGPGRSGAAGAPTAGGQTTFGTIIGASGAPEAATTRTQRGGQPLMSDLTLGQDLDTKVFNGGDVPNVSAGRSMPYGGGGGGSVEGAFIKLPGKSVFGGFGGAASRTATAENGQAPAGGGGGANNNQNGGNGAAGRVIVTVW